MKALLLAGAVLLLAGCSKESAPSDPVTPTPPATTTPPPSVPPAPTEAAKPAPLDDAKKKALAAVFEAGKPGLKKCDPQKADMDKAIATKNMMLVGPKAAVYNTCRREWVKSLMPQISKVGGVTEDQAVDEMMVWDLARKK